jgi:hypothetical protein
VQIRYQLIRAQLSEVQPFQVSRQQLEHPYVQHLPDQAVNLPFSRIHLAPKKKRARDTLPGLVGL